jgi:hypothetical protein
MGGILNVLLTHGGSASGGTAYNSSFSVNSGTGSSTTVAGRSFTYYGWCPIYNLSGHSNYQPDPFGFGSLSTGSPTGVNGLSVLGVYEGSSPDLATVDRVMVVFAGNVTPVVNSVTIAGTSRPFGGYITSISDNGNTVWIGTLATINVASLFGVSGVKTVVLT